jgi:hypothetical protein
METKEYRTVDKSAWGPGPWMDEPDKMQWQDEATGLPCLIVRNPAGAWCGYVGVAEGHPAFDKLYSEELLNGIEVHGGLTCAKFCAHSGDEAVHICHVPGAGEPDHVFWYGFDCSHAWDLCPAFDAMLNSLRAPLIRDFGNIYRDIDYVRREVASLALQLKAIA